MLANPAAPAQTGRNSNGGQNGGRRPNKEQQ
jgi:hypothetical protein